MTEHLIRLILSQRSYQHIIDRRLQKNLFASSVYSAALRSRAVNGGITCASTCVINACLPNYISFCNYNYTLRFILIIDLFYFTINKMIIAGRLAESLLWERKIKKSIIIMVGKSSPKIT